MPAWIEDIKQRLDGIQNYNVKSGFENTVLPVNQFVKNAPDDIAKLIQAVLIAEEALRDAQEHLSQYYNSMYVWSITGRALAQLQSGEFGEGE